MTDPYLDWLDEQARLDAPTEAVEREHARQDRLQDFAPLVSDARTAGTVGRLSLERKDRS